MKPSPHVSIPQIAEAAGVSKATVDRVLNDRAGVNPATAQRVKAVLASLGGTVLQPGRPKSAPNYRFAFVLPAARGAFVEGVDRIVAQSAGEFRHQHITEVTLRLPSHDVDAFAAELAKLTEYGALAVLAPDMPQVKLAINELVRAGVHVVTLFSDVPGSLRSAFLGTDNRAAGRTAALLLGHGMRSRGPVRAALLSPPTRYAAEIDRRIGFAQLMEERFAHVELLRLLEVPEHEDDAYRYVLERLPPAGTPDAIAAAYSVAGGSAGIARALAERGYAGQALFAVHDLVEAHRAMLAAGTVDYVLHQDVHLAVSAAAKTMRALQDRVRGTLTTVRSSPVEIVTRENLA